MSANVALRRLRGSWASKEPRCVVPLKLDPTNRWTRAAIAHSFRFSGSLMVDCRRAAASTLTLYGGEARVDVPALLFKCRNGIAMSQLLRVPRFLKRDPAIGAWMFEHSGGLGAIA